MTGVGRLVNTDAAGGINVLSPGQFQTDPINLTSTTKMLVSFPGGGSQTLYLRLLASGTLTGALDITFTGAYKFYIVGGSMSASTIGP